MVKGCGQIAVVVLLIESRLGFWLSGELLRFRTWKQHLLQTTRKNASAYFYLFPMLRSRKQAVQLVGNHRLRERSDL